LSICRTAQGTEYVGRRAPRALIDLLTSLRLLWIVNYSGNF